MSGNRQVPRLDKLAFEALLKNSVIVFNSYAQQEVYLRHKLKPFFLPFLQNIADAEPANVKNY